MANSTEHRAFHVPELLEAILAELSPKDLLLGKRVCKVWKDAIEDSQKLQKALFFVPEEEGRFVVTTGKVPIHEGILAR